MKINIVMDFFPGHQSGGMKIIYIYANHFAEMGNDVNLIYGIEEPMARFKGKVPLSLRKKILCTRVKTGQSWFKLDKNIKKICVQKVDDKSVPDGDVVFATAVGTAKWVYDLSLKKGKKFYLIQGFENWFCSDEIVYDTYRLGMKNIVIAKWLAELVQKYDIGKTILIPNAVDTNVFRIVNPPEKRNPHTIAMVCQSGSFKGFEYGYNALLQLKEKYPDMRCRMFGSEKPDKTWPSWIDYTYKASEAQLLEIYNSCAVFMCSSVVEGFGLCGAESMACGCALVSSDNKGVFTYATPDFNALIAEVKNSVDLFEKVSEMFDDNEMRIEFAIRGYEAVRQLSWECAYKKMDELICIEN